MCEWNGTLNSENRVEHFGKVGVVGTRTGNC